MGRRSDARPPAQNHLAGHELAVVFAERTRQRLVSRITGVGARCPFPAIAEQLLNTRTSRRSGMESSRLEQVSLDHCLARDVFPFCLGRKSATFPTCKRVSLEATYVAHGCVKQCRKSVPTRQCEHPPAGLIVSIAPPVEGRLPRGALYIIPAFG